MSGRMLLSLVEMRWYALVFLAIWLTAGIACAAPTVLKSGDYQEGTKFHPGHYVMTTISRSYSPRERNLRRIAYIKEHLDEPRIRGFMSHFEWKVLEPERGRYNLTPIADILKTLEGSDKYLVIYLRDRNFGKKCTKPPVPRYLLDKEFGRPYKHKTTCMVELYNPKVVDRKLALYRAIAEQFDKHPNLEMITDGETTIGGSEGYSPAAWANEIQRFYREAKRYFRHTMVLVQMNFLGDGSRYLSEIAATIEQTGGGALGLPDTVPCRRDDIPKEHVCGYTIPGYEVLREFRGRVAIAPNAETWDLHYDEAPIVKTMALDYLGADHVFWSRTFSSRRDRADHDSENYFSSQILPLLDKSGSETQRLCPSSLRPCIR